METGEAKLDFEAWAALSARLNGLTREERAAILDAETIEVEQWEMDDSHWIGVLAEDIKQGEMARAKKYGSACAEQLAWRRNEKEAPPPAAVTPDATAGVSAVPPVEESTHPVSTPTPALPSYLINPPKNPQFREMRSAPVLAAQDINATAEVRAIPQGPALPFNAEPAANPSLFNRDEPKLPPASRHPGDETAALPAIVALNVALPFGNAGAPTGPVPKAPSGAPATHAPSRIDARDETAAAPAIVDLKPSTPFTKPDSSDPVADLPVDPAMLTLEQYASLSAELAAMHEPRPAILKRYNLKDETARTQHAIYWAKRMQKNEPLKARYNELVATFRQHLERSRGG